MQNIEGTFEIVGSRSNSGGICKILDPLLRGASPPPELRVRPWFASLECVFFLLHASHRSSARSKRFPELEGQGEAVCLRADTKRCLWLRRLWLAGAARTTAAHSVAVARFQMSASDLRRHGPPFWVKVAADRSLLQSAVNLRQALPVSESWPGNAQVQNKTVSRSRGGAADCRLWMTKV
jgi:hypothetical protein